MGLLSRRKMKNYFYYIIFRLIHIVKVTIILILISALKIFLVSIYQSKRYRLIAKD